MLCYWLFLTSPQTNSRDTPEKKPLFTCICPSWRHRLYYLRRNEFKKKWADCQLSAGGTLLSHLIFDLPPKQCPDSDVTRLASPKLKLFFTLFRMFTLIFPLLSDSCLAENQMECFICTRCISHLHLGAEVAKERRGSSVNLLPKPGQSGGKPLGLFFALLWWVNVLQPWEKQQNFHREVAVVSELSYNY